VFAPVQLLRGIVVVVASIVVVVIGRVVVVVSDWPGTSVFLIKNSIPMNKKIKIRSIADDCWPLNIN